MTTVFNNSFDSSPNSDSDDDFMVDSIISSDCKPCNSKSMNIKAKCTPLMKKATKCTKILNAVKRDINVVSKLPLKQHLYNHLNTDIERQGPYTKFVKLTSDINQPLDSDSDNYPGNNCFYSNSIPIKMKNSNTYNEYYSNAPSPFTESDKTHSVESSPSRILLNDPIITSVVLNEMRFNSSADSSSRLPSDDNFFNDMPVSFDKSCYSTSIDDNLLRPMRYNQFLGSSSQTPTNSSSVNKNNRLSLTFSKNENNKQTLSQDRRVRSSESLQIRKSVPLSVVSETKPDYVHSSPTTTTTTTVVSSYPKKLQSSNNGHNKRKHLLQFIIDLLKEGHSCVNWSNKKEKEFFIAQPEKLALIWATYKNNNKMTFDSLARSLRLYYAPKKLERISGKKNHYRILNLSHEISFNL